MVGLAFAALLDCCAIFVYSPPYIKQAALILWLSFGRVLDLVLDALRAIR